MYDKEIVVIVASFWHWRHFLQAGNHQVKVFRDHKNLTYFMSTKRLTRRHARWALYLREFNFVVMFQKGSENGPLDALSPRVDYDILPENENKLQLLNQKPRSGCLRNSQHPFGSAFCSTFDWPLIIADVLLSGGLHWIPDLPEFLCERCKKELARFTLKGNQFLRILNDGQSTAANL